MARRIVSSVLIVAYAIAIQALLLELFPNPGPATMATVPMTLLIGVFIALINYFIIKRFVRPAIIALYLLAVFGALTFVSVMMYPEEEPIEQVSLAYDLYKNPDKVRYEDLFRLNYQKEAVYVTAALAKFRDTIPDQAYRISYCCNGQVEYFIAKYGDKFVTNNEQLRIDDYSKVDTVIFRDTFNDEVVVFGSPPHVFGKNTGWGHYIDNETRMSTIFYNKCNFAPLSGFNSIYFRMIN